jgi:hypothetical protein
MKHFVLNCADWLEKETTGNNYHNVHREFQHLTNDADVSAFVELWIRTLQGMPEQQRAQMAGWWTANIWRRTEWRPRRPPHEPKTRFWCSIVYDWRKRQTDLFVTYVTLMEWLAMGGRRDVWDNYVRKGASRIMNKKFFKEFRAYEKKSRVDRNMLVAVLNRGFY